MGPMGHGPYGPWALWAMGLWAMAYGPWGIWAMGHTGPGALWAMGHMGDGAYGREKTGAGRATGYADVGHRVYQGWKRQWVPTGP